MTSKFQYALEDQREIERSLVDQFLRELKRKLDRIQRGHDPIDILSGTEFGYVTIETKLTGDALEKALKSEPRIVSGTLDYMLYTDPEKWPPIKF